MASGDTLAVFTPLSVSFPASCEGDRARDHARHRAVYVGGHFEPVYSVRGFVG